MRLRPGDRLRCSNPDCQLQVIVTDIASEQERDTLLQCYCGFPMKKSYVKPAAHRLDLTSGSRKPDATGRSRQ